MGAKRGLFLSTYQRSLHNAATQLRARPWWAVEETSYQSQIRYVFVSIKLLVLNVLTLQSRICVPPFIFFKHPTPALIRTLPLIDFSFFKRRKRKRRLESLNEMCKQTVKETKRFFRRICPRIWRAIVNAYWQKISAFYILETTMYFFGTKFVEENLSKIWSDMVCLGRPYHFALNCMTVTIGHTYLIKSNKSKLKAVGLFKYAWTFVTIRH